MPYISKEIIERLKNINSEEVAIALGIRVIRHKACCFLHDERNPSLSFKGSRWHCYGCGKGGNSIDLVMQTGLNFQDACQYLCSMFGISLIIEQQVKAYVPQIMPIVKYPVSQPSNIDFDQEFGEWLIAQCHVTVEAKDFLFTQRKYSMDVIKELGIRGLGYTNEIVLKAIDFFGVERCINAGFLKYNYGKYYCRFFTPCLLFPYRDLNGSLSCIQSRYLGTSKNAPRFQYLAGTKPSIFNMPILKKIKQNEELFISEGITDCIAMLSAGHKAVAIPSATTLSISDLEIFKDYRIKMCPDNDAAGLDAFLSISRFFLRRGRVIHRFELPYGVKDYSEFYIQNISIKSK